MLKTFKEANRFLESYIPEPKRKHPGKLGLERMQYFVSLLGNPQLSYPTIHVGGTSGKGSTATIIAYLLAAKYKVGLHTSPHLEKVTERMKIIKKCKAVEEFDIPDGEFVELVNDIRFTIKKVEKSRYGKPSYFEIVTALSFLYFQKKKVDIAVIEVGMGGRYDGTNVVKPEVAVITNVGLDHTQVLGDTVEKIAKDKVGIIKPRVKIVSGATQVSVRKIIREKCKKEGAGLSLLTKSLQIPPPRRRPKATSEVSCRSFTYQVKRLTEKGSVFDYFGENTYRDLRLSLLGEHQVRNACLAIQVIEHLSNNPITQSSNNPIKMNTNKYQLANQLIKKRDIRKALKNVFIPGRLEIVSEKPLVILDGAHNPDKMKVLVKAIKTIFSKKVVAVAAIKKGKNAQKMLSYLLPICSRVIFTKFKLTTDLGDAYSYEPGELVNVIKDTEIKNMEIRIVRNPQEAVGEAIKSAEKDDLILVTGSLYLVGEVRKFLTEFLKWNFLSFFTSRISKHQEFNIKNSHFSHRTSSLELGFYEQKLNANSRGYPRQI